jgi:hypothetical protein
MVHCKGCRASFSSTRGQGPTRALVLLAAALVAIGFLVLALPPIVRFTTFLLSGDVWRGLLAAALISLLVGLALLIIVGSLDRPTPSDPVRELRPTRSRASLWSLAWILVALVPVACILVALVASGALLDIIDWAGDRVSEIRGAQSS